LWFDRGSAGRYDHRVIWGLYLPLLALPFCGCHLIFPFDVGQAPPPDLAVTEGPPVVDLPNEARADTQTPQDSRTDTQQDGLTPPDSTAPVDVKKLCTAVKLDNASSPQGLYNADTMKWPHVTGCSGACIMIVAFASNSATVSSVTYNGAPLTRISYTLSPRDAEIWMLDAPTKGTGTVVLKTTAVATLKSIAGSSTWRCGSATKTELPVNSDCDIASSQRTVNKSHSIPAGAVLLDVVSAGATTILPQSSSQFELWNGAYGANSSHTQPSGALTVQTLGWWIPANPCTWVRCWVQIQPVD
jgi:hypothetical protein